MPQWYQIIECAFYSPSSQKYDVGSPLTGWPLRLRRWLRILFTGLVAAPRPKVTDPPPEGEWPMVSVPPEASAIRRTMSRPRPVEPPVELPRSVGSVLPNPGPLSATTNHAPPAARGLSRMVRAEPSGVCA